MTIFCRIDLVYDLKGHRVVRGRQDLPYDPKGHGDLCGRFDLVYYPLGSVPVDFLRHKFRVAHTKQDVISILINKYTYINMSIIKKIISCIFILCWDITALLKLKWKFAGYV